MSKYTDEQIEQAVTKYVNDMDYDTLVSIQKERLHKYYKKCAMEWEIEELMDEVHGETRRVSKQEIYREASGNFLTDTIPIGFVNTPENMEKFIEEHRWDVLDDHIPWSEVEDLITSCAKGMENLLQSKGIVVYDEEEDK